MCNDLMVTLPMVLAMWKLRFGRFCKKKGGGGDVIDMAVAPGGMDDVDEDSAAAAVLGALERRGLEPAWSAALAASFREAGYPTSEWGPTLDDMQDGELAELMAAVQAHYTLSGENVIAWGNVAAAVVMEEEEEEEEETKF
jgi:hypothetical protein